jgi:hypothetical protein
MVELLDVTVWGLDCNLVLQSGCLIGSRAVKI